MRAHAVGQRIGSFAGTIASDFKKVNVEVFSDLIFSFWGIELNSKEKQWFACDGKELRGSIAKGELRGEAVVQAVSHKDRIVHGQEFYNGMKESERPCACVLLRRGLDGQKITMDALHLIPETVKQIEKQQGIFLIGLKENQKELLTEMKFNASVGNAVVQEDEPEKSHGRIDKRKYSGFDVGNAYFDERWQGANFQTLVKIERTSLNLKSQTESSETAYYLSNQQLKKGTTDQELFNAVRGHWNVETNNNIRDVTFKEDHLKTKHQKISRNIATCRTYILNLLYKLKLKNIKAKLEEFADDFQILLQWLTTCRVL